MQGQDPKPSADAPVSASRAFRGAGALPLFLVAAAAALLLFWRLGERYLWQDEAACALMAERMLSGGKPLAYGEGDLITMDEFQGDEAATLARRTGDPATAVAYYVAKGDFKPDTTWIGQPWGQFAWTAASFALFGTGTLQARLPFALAGVLTAVVLFAFARRRTGSAWIAAAAVVLCLGSAYWVLHVRQCRYYATSSLFLLFSVVLYFRWQDAPRSLGRAALFVLTAWVYFHNDFGSFWPVMGVLAADGLLAALREDRSRLVRVLVTFALIGLLVAPFAFYYELLVLRDGHLASGRFKEPAADFAARLGILLVYLNRFQFPFVLAPFVLLLALLRGPRAARGRRVVLVAFAILVAQLAWMSAVSPFPFYRYLVDMTPLASLVVAWVLVEGARALLPAPRAAAALGGALVLFVLLTPWAADAAQPLIPVPPIIRQLVPPAGGPLRHELRVLAMDLDQQLGDPNGELVRFLRPRLRPGDEVTINYEDVPLQFYLDCPVRGGIACFRVEDRPPPRFLVLRQSVGFTHQAPYKRLLASRRWRRLECDAPDITWGNNPDPWCHWSRQKDELKQWGSLEVFEDLGPLRPGDPTPGDPPPGAGGGDGG